MVSKLHCMTKVSEFHNHNYHYHYLVCCKRIHYAIRFSTHIGKKTK
jgi:hypothetical protein